MYSLRIVRWSFLVLAMVAIFLGPTAVYRAFDMANVVAALIVVILRWHTHMITWSSQ